MSTKNYNLDLQNNNIQLQEIFNEINNLPAAGEGSNTENEDALITGEIITYENRRVEIIKEHGFYNCFSLTSINFPLCKTIGSSAFHKCYNLSAVSFPVCERIYQHAFNDCNSLRSAIFPVCKSIDIYAFQDCDYLTSISFPICEKIENNAFIRCKALTFIDFPSCKIIGANAFYQCSALISAQFSVCSQISSSAFAYCNNLIDLTLGASSVATLSHINAFTSTPMSISTLTGSFGSIYVPHPLVNLYKSATNWTTYADRIVGTETEQCISFTIADDNFWAFEGMTWGDLLTGLYYQTTLGEAEPGYPCHMTPGPEYGGIFAYITANGTPVSTSDTIIANYNYGLRGVF